VQLLGLLAAVAAALPGVHGAAQARVLGGPAGGGEPAVAVVEQGAGDLGQMEVEVRQYEQLVPEDVPPVRLAVQPAGRHPDIQLDGVRREGLQHMEEMQPQDLARLPRHVEIGPLPQGVPGVPVGDEQPGEVRRLADPVDGGLHRVADRGVVRGVQGHGLLHRDRHPVGDRHREQPAGPRAVREVRELGPLALGDAGARGHRDPDVGVGGAAAQPVGARLFRPAGLHMGEVVAVQAAVAGHAGVGHAAVEYGLDLQPARPADGRERGAQRGQMRVAHMDQAVLLHPHRAAAGAGEVGGPGEHARAQVEPLPVAADLGVVGGEPAVGLGAWVRGAGAEAQREPVGQVDHVLVLDLAS
jgi:hypothetical protein